MWKRSVVIHRKPVKIPKWNYKRLLFFTLFLCGFLIGVLSISRSESGLLENLSQYLHRFFRASIDETVFRSFCGALFLALLLPAAVFFCGMSATGVPLVCAVPAIGGVLMGTLVTCYYRNFGFGGLGFLTLTVIPAFAVQMAVVIMNCSEAAELSMYLFGTLVQSGKDAAPSNRLKGYCRAFLVRLIPIVLASAGSALSMKLFGSLFSFV